MTYPDFLTLLAAGEGERLEFKKTLTHAYKIARTLVAFANTAGGTVLIGVLDNGHPVGMRDAEEERFALRQAQVLTDPEVPLLLDEIELPYPAETVVVRARVAESARKPHRVNVAPRASAPEWRVYVRAGAKSVQTSPLMEKILRHEPPSPPSETAAEALTRHETAVLAMFVQLPRVTAAHVRQLLNLSERRVHQLLLRLTVRGHLLEHTREREPFWTRRGTIG
ncbi:MAG: ATP-binding protein [Hymenobacteraceae bacterium]|nr:ATP-binding protein [Hymenobacteraceae bacterium]